MIDQVPIIISLCAIMLGLMWALFEFDRITAAFISILGGILFGFHNGFRMGLIFLLLSYAVYLATIKIFLRMRKKS